jgi:hypothetical protein
VGSWRWGGPAWTATVPEHPPGGLRQVTVAADDPDGVRRRWADVIGVDARDGDTLVLDDGRQRVRFVRAGDRRGIVAATIALPMSPATATVGGVEFTIESADG